MKSPRVSFRLPETTLQAIDLLIQNKMFQDRSAFFRLATDQLLKHYKEFEASLKEAAQ